MRDDKFDVSVFIDKNYSNLLKNEFFLVNTKLGFKIQRTRSLNSITANYFLCRIRNIIQ